MAAISVKLSRQLFVARRGLCGFALLVVSGCARNTLSDGLSERQDCSACHGRSGDPAPPNAVSGASETTDIGVGAHTVHLSGGQLGAPVACSECHPLPTNYLTHPSLNPRSAIVQFGPLASLYGAVPLWDRAARTCNQSYCHGATLSGAETRVSPIWTQVDGTFRRCSSCHGFPPKGSHPAATACETCHGEVVGRGATIVNASRHVDGVVDISSATSSTTQAYRTSSKRFCSLSLREGAWQ